MFFQNYNEYGIIFSALERLKSVHVFSVNVHNVTSYRFRGARNSNCLIYSKMLVIDVENHNTNFEH